MDKLENIDIDSIIEKEKEKQENILDLLSIDKIFDELYRQVLPNSESNSIEKKANFLFAYLLYLENRRTNNPKELIKTTIFFSEPF